LTPDAQEGHDDVEEDEEHAITRRLVSAFNVISEGRHAA